MKWKGLCIDFYEWQYMATSITTNLRRACLLTSRQMRFEVRTNQVNIGHIVKERCDIAFLSSDWSHDFHDGQQ